jgi:DMSO/TMAO reductase YedYZ heme-binding membrane subunit
MMTEGELRKRRITSNVFLALVIVVYTVIVVAITWVFFSERGGFGMFEGSDLARMSRRVFPLLGLYAFYLVWVQIMFRANLALRVAVPPWVHRFHRAEGLFALLFAILHPSFLVIGVGLQSYLAKDFVAHDQAIYVLLGQLQLVLLLVTVLTVLLRRQPWLVKRWRSIHILNYAVFVSAWVHSWKLGTDVQSTGLRWLWLWFGVTGGAVLLLRLWTVSRQRMRRVAPAPQPSQPMPPTPASGQ